jgi:hypothetical protein
VAAVNFTLANATTATLGIGDANGITTTGGTDGNVQVTGTRTFGTLANYIYNGNVAQITGNALTTCNSLTIDNAAGVTQQNATNTAQNVVVSNQLTLTNGTYLIGGVFRRPQYVNPKWSCNSGYTNQSKFQYVLKFSAGWNSARYYCAFQHN